MAGHAAGMVRDVPGSMRPNVAARGEALIAGLACGHWREADLPALEPSAVRVAGPSGDAALRALSRSLWLD
jgi:hypothetical protein